ncbi:MAG TPA: HAD family phosphatase [Allosphingosinicella sp.]|nr:HAD family phosphatase [Allosphingosinicella sp.]
MRFRESTEQHRSPELASRTFDGLILDFDGVLLESEYAGNLQLARYLTGAGYPTSVEQSMANFMGLSGSDFHAAVESWIGGPLTPSFHEARAAEDARVLEEGLEAVAGAVRFVGALPADLPKAVASSSSSRWVERHLDHLGLRHHFNGRIFSGAEHVARGKPAPDLYLHAADAIGVPIERIAIVEDSPVGVKGAVASGGFVIGLCAGRHCLSGHGETLRGLGVHALANSFEEVEDLLGLRT